IVDQPFESYKKLVNHFRPFQSATQLIDVTAVIGNDSYIAPNVFIGEHVTIGNHSIIHPNVTIHGHCVIGYHVVIQAGSCIGSDAFYYNTKKNREHWYQKMPSCGRVVIGDHVEIGAGCTIDRGVTHDTSIG
ncbi:MAG: UDP-3-O-(3-hydroxymyristoyl)glucosamine N-acyltransferase, partial [bacterium]